MIFNLLNWLGYSIMIITKVEELAKKVTGVGAVQNCFKRTCFPTNSNSTVHILSKQ